LHNLKEKNKNKMINSANNLLFVSKIY